MRQRSPNRHPDLATWPKARYPLDMWLKPSSVALLLLTCALPPAVQAHPHIFVDTSLALRIDDQGQLLGVEVSWAYDDFYSLLIFEDRQLDADFDGELTAAELQQLEAFDMQWDADFAGDIFLTQQDAPIALDGPEHLATEVSAGRITTRHFRPLSVPVPADQIVIQAYDPTYYTAYTVATRVSLPGGSPCSATVEAPNLDQAYTLVEETLYSLSSLEAEENYPEIGKSFADTVRIICDHGS